MTQELRSLREHFGRLIVALLWLHVPLMLFVSWLTDHDQVSAVLVSVMLAGIYHLSAMRYGDAATSRYIGVVAMMAQPALMVYLLRGHPWQMDMHMYFFAMLALTIAWFDRRAILLAAAAVALHHIILLYLLPYAVFPADATLSRVLFHALIVAFQTTVLVWISGMIEEAFFRIRVINDELVTSNARLEARTSDALRSTDSKSLFLANMSHEIRTPLNAVLGFCYLLQRTALSARQEDYVGKISNAGSMLLRLINDILDLSKNEAGKLSLEAAAFSPHGVIEQQFQLLLETAKAKGITLELQKDPTLPSLLIGDALRFGQVVLNLLNNAVKFTEKGSVTVRTGVQSRDDQALMLAVDVTDTGIGMTEAQRERLFASFTQADNTMTRRYGGTGLGLAISRQIVELMEGEIDVQSEPWVGTTFRFTVRLGLTSALPAADRMPSPALRDLRILTLDDNSASLQLVQEIFAGWNMTAEAAATGAEAIERLEGAAARGLPYDLVLLDWKMPGMDGLEIIEAVRANPRIAVKPKMVLVTAYGSETFTREVEEAGVAGYLPKPLEAAALAATLDDLFESLLPIAPPIPAPTEPKPHVTPPMVRPELHGLRILLVEDNLINREIALQLLTDAGLLADAVENGQEAVEQVAKSGDDYALVLMDLQMPVMDGLEATRIIREHWTATRLPIIAMTAHAYADERQRCLDIGMNDHVSKPVEPDVLIETLNKWLKPRPHA